MILLLESLLTMTFSPGIAPMTTPSLQPTSITIAIPPSTLSIEYLIPLALIGVFMNKVLKMLPSLLSKGSIVATIFAYSQTSSGKTYTLKGIADNCINDISAHITNATASRFVLKFSVIEIYNETVVDLLNCDSGALRLLDDPEKGTVVEKLTEEVVRNSQHLRSLIATCEDQRQVGETSLNDRSSRSHQIIRLTIESSFHDESGCVKSLLANLSLVDLAGSERASQTYAAGA
ncbi:putative plus-end-directed kinesin ATPase [Helianthus annuus]|nr:putative plus-end-directed kinesin ATPase [Helianthus annuus]